MIASPVWHIRRVGSLKRSVPVLTLTVVIDEAITGVLM